MYSQECNFQLLQIIIHNILQFVMIIVPNSSGHKGKEERGEMKGEYGGVCREDERNAGYWGIVQPSQQHIASCVKGFKWGLEMRGLKIVAAFWAGIPWSFQPRL